MMKLLILDPRMKAVATQTGSTKMIVLNYFSSACSLMSLEKLFKMFLRTVNLTLSSASSRLVNLKSIRDNCRRK